MTTLTLTDKGVDVLDVDALVVLSVKEGEHAVPLPAGLPVPAVEHLTAAMRALSASAGEDECLRFTSVPGLSAPLVVVSGTGLAAAPTAADHEAVRAAAGAATRGLAGTQRVAVLAPGGSAELAAATSEGALFGAYTYTAYRRTAPAKQPPSAITVVSPTGRGRAARRLTERAQAVADAQAFARDLVNTPPNDLFPQAFADRVGERLAGTPVKVRVMDEKALAKAGCGGLIGVGRGSSRPPRLVRLTYRPARAKASVALVGKGITFDSGGLCIKPAASMITMKCDMAGAAAAAAAVEAVARLGLPVAVTAYLCLAENMTGSDAQRPGDVVTMPNGKTVEIVNTDAEGRLVMADGLALASQKQPDVLVDIATLTGAAVMALGARTTAVLANDEDASRRMTDAAARVGERQWPMPLAPELRKAMDSDVADVKHTGDRNGGMITAALFLREFVGKGADGAQLPWVHLDIAGPAFNEAGAYGYTPKGATGHGVRTLVEFVASHA